MDFYFSDISRNLDDELKKISEEIPDILKKTEQSIFCLKACLQQLKECALNNPFQSQDEEIYFFKEIKPSIYSKLIYFVEILNIESKRPIGNTGDLKKYWLKEQKKLRSFFEENVDFYTYYRNKSTHLDEKYFLRNEMDIRLCLNDYVFDTDPAFSTSHDMKVSRILAYDMLNTYLNEQLNQLDLPKDQTPVETGKCKLTWTESKIALVELIYGLHATGCINNGAGDIKEVAHLFETIFDIELGDFYRTYMEIKTRQNSTKFLDIMRSALTHKIDEQDE